MGYCMEQMASSFFIEKQFLEQVRDRIVAFSKEDRRWVDPIEETVSVKDAFAECRWDVNLDAEGNIDGISFSGEKAGDDNILFSRIAEFVLPGSYIQMLGEDNSIWRWIFTEQGRVIEQYARVQWS